MGRILKKMDIQRRLQAALRVRYRIDRLLGEGGMALVYLAEDLKHGRPVALKVLRPEVSMAVGTERFLREIEIAARLNHPNVLALHDSGEADGLLFFVMPFLEGESLRGRLEREGHLSLGEALRIATEIGDALDYAHAHGLVHRDVKPENVLFQAGHALVCDFGIARVAGGAEERLTRTGASIGTLAYMSPEQFEATVEVDPRTDVYALGCVVYEMLSGSNPFDARTQQAILARKLAGQVSDLSELRPDLPVTVQPVVSRALSVEPDDRFSSAGIFVEALRDAGTRRAVEAEERRRRRAGLARRVGTALGVLALGTVSWMVSRVLTGPAMERIVVLPLENAQRDTAQDFFVEGAYADLVDELARTVRVISRPSAVRMAELGLRPREIAVELGVDGVVTGRASFDPRQVMLTLQLLDGRTEEIVWTRRFEAPPSGILGLYHQVSLAIAEQMGVSLDDEQRARLAADEEVDPQVMVALLQARFQWQKLTREGIDTAEDYYRLALSLDSLSAEAWWGLAQVWGLRAQMGTATGEEALAKGAEYRERAAELDPDLVARDGGVRAWLQWDFEGAEEAYRSDLAHDPTDAVARAYFAEVLLFRGKEAEADREMAAAVEGDPYNTRVLSIQGHYLNFRRRYEEAEVAFRKVLEREPNEPMALSNARTTLHHLGRYEEAMPIWREYYASQGDTGAVQALDAGYARGGYGEALRAVADEYVERRDRAKLWQVATLYARAGDVERTLDYLEEAVAVRDPNTPYITIDPLFDDLRDEPRFKALVDTIFAPR
jgi:TolB-like protein/Tfp pilus assembly protein PilF